MNRRISIVATLLLFVSFIPTNASAASSKDKALSLAASGCVGGWLDSTMFNNPNNISFVVISTASGSQWNDATNNSYVQIHHTQMLEGWSLAANLDSKWNKLSTTYSQIYEYIGNEASRGTLIGDIWNTAERKFGGIVNANCKIALASARAKAKSSGKSLPRWIVSTAGNLLPPLDPRTKPF